MNDVAATLDRWLRRDRVRLGALAVLSVGVAASLGNLVVGLTTRPGLRLGTGNMLLSDFLAHWTAGRLLLDGRLDQLYDADAQAALQHALVGEGGDVAWFVGPPYLAVVYAPFAALPYPVAVVVWVLLSFAALLAALWLLLPLLPRLSRDWGVVVLVVLASQPVLEALGAGQDSAFSLLAWAGGLRLLVVGRDALAGSTFALGLLKPQLVVLQPVTFVAERRWRALLGWLAVAVLVAVACVAVVGIDGVREWLGVPFTARYHEQVNVGQAWKMLSVPALLVTLVPTSLATAAELAGLVLAGAFVVVFAVTAWRARRTAVLEVWALAGLTTVVASPHLLTYDLLVALPAVLVLLDRHDSRRVRLALLAVFILTYLNPALHLVAERVPWPMAALGTTWAVIPLLVLWDVARRACHSPAVEPVPAVG